MGARYRLEWRFRAHPGEVDASPSLRTSSDRIKAAGIVQAGDAILAAVAEPFDLPEQAKAAKGGEGGGERKSFPGTPPGDPRSHDQLVGMTRWGRRRVPRRRRIGR
ncbi:hypothetical protein [Spongiactinospora rosea]|uniref:hypothetical protein n=1 Tax=Spongiactinospora rosea TaxID=2248750 RepID=UPI0011C0748D|nr:hypothetical protein [Spongiactinospora rosea]